MDNLENIIDEIVSEKEKDDKDEKPITEEELKDIVDKETSDDIEDDDFLELLEETPDEDGFVEEDLDLLKEDFPEEDLKGLEGFDIDKYLKDNYAFKEIEELSFDEYKQKELAKPEIRVIEKIYNQGQHLKDLETFDDFLKFKKQNILIFSIRFGMPFEYELFGLEPRIFICKAFTSKDYLDMIKDNPDADKDLDYFNDYIISSSVLYPILRLEDVSKLEYGILDLLLQMILKHSRFNTNYKIERL